jgi:hypothetical protein
MPWPLSPLFLFPDPSMFRWFLSTTIHSIGIGISISWHYLALPPSPRELLFRQAPQLKPPALPRLTALHTVHYHNTKRRISISCLSLPGSVPPRSVPLHTTYTTTLQCYSEPYNLLVLSSFAYCSILLRCSPRRVRLAVPDPATPCLQCLCYALLYVVNRFSCRPLSTITERPGSSYHYSSTAPRLLYGGDVYLQIRVASYRLALLTTAVVLL